MKFLNKGSFSKVFLEDDGKNVLIYSTDKAKKCLSLNLHSNISGIFPECTEIKKNIYKMKYYPRLSLKKLKPDQYHLYKMMQALHWLYFTYDDRGWKGQEHAISLIKLITNCDGKVVFGPDCINGEIVDLPNDVKADLISMAKVLKRFGKAQFDVSKKNIAIDKGKLILMDCFFYPKDHF